MVLDYEIYMGLTRTNTLVYFGHDDVMTLTQVDLEGRHEHSKSALNILWLCVHNVIFITTVQYKY